jgi:hypothetical protein
MGKIKIIVGIFLVILYIGVGVYCLIYNYGKGNVNSDSLWLIFGYAAIVYGIFRAIRVYQQYKDEKQ